MRKFLIPQLISMCNILVTGSNGQLGSQLRELASEYLNFNFFFTDKSMLDITLYKSVKEFIINNKINAIINCAAYTDVQKAENEFNLANAVNHLAVANFAELAKKYDIRLIHISTDYVFDGECDRPYNEFDITNPQTVYGQTKLNGELKMRKINPKQSIIIRTSWLYSTHGNNFFNNILLKASKNDKIEVVNDQIGSPTNAIDLARAILHIIPKLKNDQVEVYHYSNEGYCSWYEFAKAILNFYKKPVKLNSIKTNKLNAMVKRPKYSVLDSSAIKNKFKLAMKEWNENFIF